MSEFKHIPVLLEETISSLDIAHGATVIDATAGGGGHLREVIKRMPPTARAVAFDRDPTAIAHLKHTFAKEISSGRLHLIAEPFDRIKIECERLNLPPVTTIYADLGVSSPQLDDASRGFSFLHNGPLDMRMNPSEGIETAAALLARMDPTMLTSILRNFGEEPKASYLARKIMQRQEKQPFTETQDLAQFVANNLHYAAKSRTHPATRTFQALRIAVNQEFEQLTRFMSEAFSLLATGGRLAIISFHSLEDRPIKQFFRSLEQPHAEELQKLKKLPIKEIPEKFSPLAKIIKPFPIVPSGEEIQANPRARSAKLRIIEKI